MGGKKYKLVKKSSGSKTSKPVKISEKIRNRKLNQKYSKKSIKSDSDNSESEPEIVSYKINSNNKKYIKYEADKSYVKKYESNNSDSDSEIESEISESNENSKVQQLYSDNDLRNVIYEDINDKFSYGKLGDFNIVMMKKNGYVNATNLCKNIKKEFYHWKENKNSKELIKELISSPDYPGDEPIITITGGKITKIRGTYVHPELIIHIASWCSPKYALKVSKIVIEYHSMEMIEERNRLLKIKDGMINRLSKKLDRQNNKIDELLQKNEKMDNRIKRLVKKNDEIYNINQDMLGKIDVISNDRVVKGKTSDNHMFVIVKNNDDPDEYEDDEELYEYSAFRLMKKSYKIRMSEHLERHPNMEIILKICHSPNSMNLWNRIKTKLGKKKITYSGCNFNLEDNYTENKLVRDIKKIHNERLDTDDI
ncbi:putative kilA-n domain protein [Saudi moumouvirus]|nr:putative kilA-n domain protein [Saudi moumouvirus]